MTPPASLRAFARFARAVVTAFPARVAASVCVMLGMSALEGIGLLLLVPLLQLVGVDSGGGALTGLVGYVAVALRVVRLEPTLATVLLIYVAAVALQSVLQRREAILRLALQHEVMGALRMRVYRAIAGARWTHLARERSSALAHVLTEEVSRVGTLTYLSLDLAVASVMSLLYVALAFRVSPSMTALVVGLGTILGLTARGTMARAHRHGQRHSSSSDALFAAVAEQLASMKIAKSYGVEERHAAVFARLSDELGDVGVRAARSYSWLRQQLTIASAAVLAIIVYVSYAVLHISTAQLLLSLLLFARLVPRLTSLYERGQSLASFLPAFERVCDVEARCLAGAEETDRPTRRASAAGPAVAEHRGPVCITLRERVAFEEVTFQYGDGDEKPALRAVSLDIPAGRTTAIVGPSGAGKSTLADLLIGLIEPTEGRRLVDGRPLGPRELRSWRQRIGYVAQDTFLFHDTVRANLAWANPDASDPEIREALRLAAADRLVDSLPDGLDTVLGDRGVLVSGGERQRLALARALLRKPDLLILDEATSSLDSENEARIQQAIEKLHRRMTIVIITHRLPTVRDADLIHVLDAGRLVESGTWADLAARPGRFHELLLAQAVEGRGTAMADPPPRSVRAVAG
ncbi:MAG: ABC transporter ATP-binding protein [Vicinamibacterales bacterium]